MKLASYIDRNSAHEVLYKAVSRDEVIYRGVLVRPNMLVSLNDNDPDIVASTEEEALERLLWVMLNQDDKTPEGFVEVKPGYDSASVRGFFYDEYDEYDESDLGEKKFHGLLSSGSDITLDAADVWVRPWSEGDGPAEPGPVYVAEYSDRWSPSKHERGFLAWDPEYKLFRELKEGGQYLNSSVYNVNSVERVPQVGEVVDRAGGAKLDKEGYRLKGVGRGVELVTEVPPEVQEALRWL